jgi:putative SOS response-associated peptidase YedK
MCGRYVATSTPEQVADFFGAAVEAEAIPPSWNVAPTDDVLAVVAEADGEGGVALAVRAFHWGLVPVWAKDVKIGSSMINARAETINDKPAYKPSFRKYRCLVPMDGFYEWQAAREGGPVGAKGKPVKQPYYITAKDGEPLAVAGVWSVWRDRSAGKDAPWLHSLAVVTTAANDDMAKVHERMPVVLPKKSWQAWLDPRADDYDALVGLLRPAPNGSLTITPVSTEVNKVANNGPELIEPAE